MHEKVFCVYVCAHFALQVWFTGFQVRGSGDYRLKPKDQLKVYEW